MFNEISYYPIFGLPLILYLGSLTMISLLTTATIMFLNDRKLAKIPFKWHHLMAKITIVLALIHGTFGILAYF